MYVVRDTRVELQEVELSNEGLELHFHFKFLVSAYLLENVIIRGIFMSSISLMSKNVIVIYSKGSSDDNSVFYIPVSYYISL